MLNVTKNVTLPLDNALLIVSYHLVSSSKPFDPFRSHGVVPPLDESQPNFRALYERLWVQ